MNMLLKEDIVSLTDFARNTRKHTNALKKTSRPSVLTHNGRACAVVLSVEQFQVMSDTVDEHAADMRLREALEAYDRGEEGTPADIVAKRLSSRAAARRKRVA